MPVVAGQGITLTGTWAPLHSNTVTYQGLDPRIVEIGLEQRIATPRGRLDLSLGTGFPSAGTASVQSVHPMAPAAGVVQVNVSRYFPSSGFSQSVVATWGPHAAATTIAPTPTLLHAYTAFPDFDIPNRRVQWSEATAGATADFAVALLQITRSAEKRAWRWDIVGPRPTPALILPVVPTDVIDFNPVETDGVSVDRLDTYQVPGGYDAARAHAFANDLEGLATTPAGQVVREEIFFQPL